MAEVPSFGRYRVTGPLGAGGMGEVYAAVDEVLGREVAVKTLKGHRNGLAARMLDERFRHEARAIAQFSHPGVVQVFDIDLAAEPPYIVMERVAGPSLKERLAQGPLELSDVRALGIQIGRALATAHAAGIVHRDVKPANILAATGGMWKLADFGVAHVPDSSLTMTGQFVGSPAYAPPEALVRGESGSPGDVFGLGATLYEAALGRWPRADATTGGLLAPVPKLRELAPHLPPDLADAIDRAVAIEPEARPTANQLADVLARAPAAVAAVEVVAPVAPAALRWKQLVAGVLGLVVIIAIVAVAARGSSTSAGTPATSPSPSAETPPEQPPDKLTAVTPPIAMQDRRAAKDWKKVVEKLYKHDYREALHKLEEFERKFGASDETTALRDQLARLPDDRRREDD